ncbi:protein-L-isoaspartate O-methyltransferase [Chitinivorax sp. B]|uniref:protein-L-isoaspartate O-methyltransferase family protein n=1 Tax=Chitinivorax sp. B TaxID=2502235 RepID=UPI0010F7D021|nr:protein-L-isoaspartate O-methyltransferase [Chitinivorax sp. B]
MNWEEARFNMVEQQIRPWDVLDQEILSLLFEVKREEFVPVSMHNLAFVDMELPLPNGCKMWQPKLEARVVQDLAIKPTDKVLEIGSGSGYLTALLAKRAQHVYSVEMDAEQTTTAKSNLLKAGLGNVTIETGDGSRGWTKHAPYDVIVITGSMPVLPDEFKQQLAVGGRMFAILGDAPVMSGTLVTRTSSAAYNTTKLFETVVAPLNNALQPERFTF